MSRVERLAREDRAGSVVLMVIGGVFVVGLAMQVIHMFEHAIQTGRWIVQPTLMPWMSPWGHDLSDLLANAFAGGRHMVGMEMAHLVANVLFEAGIIAGLSVAWARGRNSTGLRRAAIFQGIHLAEHVSITFSALAINTPIGLTTWWGLLDAGTPAAIANRVLLHFTLNLIATLFAVNSMGDALGGLGRQREHRVPQPVYAPGPQPV